MNVMAGQPPAAEEPAPDGKAAANDSALSSEHPFPGLRPFTFADRDFFFGRESQAFALYRLVENGRFIAVVGGSGSGKSSLVLAGLCDLLDQETKDRNGPNWVCRDMRPGGAPIRRLAATLARISATDDADLVRLRDRIDSRLRQSSFSLESAIEEAGGLGGRHLLLIVDQFEELFRFGLGGLGQRRAGAADAKARDEATQFVQILLDADRRRLPNVHVLITMRSDFIGDCAYFTGLPEAVSATQYLVPGLTRTQFEEVIRRPIEKAGGSIEPELVERLLNDCGDELDPLPVLQHCLMRLWDRAGVASGGGARRLTRQTYDDIGRMTEALSRHADEVLRACAGKELSVEQAFRALSELDREGRPIRRGRRFEKLLAETGVAEADLRSVLDRFRAPTCSFLVPPPSSAAVLANDDVVDIGHEALLRRWKKLSGGATAGTAAAAPTSGWLADEQSDGRRYGTFVALLDREKATLDAPGEIKRWWDLRPRTAAWAERYGGRFEEVKRLISQSIAAKQRRRIALSLVALAVCAGIGSVFYLYQHDARLRQEAIDKSAMMSAKTLLERVNQAYNNHSLDLAGASSIATVSEQFLNDIRASSQTSAADSLWAEALDIDADLQTTSRHYKWALDLATKAREAAAREAALHPDPSDPQARDALHLLYETTIRTGDALAAPTIVRFDDALASYKDAETIAEKVISIRDDAPTEADLVDAHIKIGDVPEIRENYADAIKEYRAGLAAADAALQKFPGRTELLRNRGKAFYRIAESLRSEGSLEEARKAYQAALDIQGPLVQNDPPDSPDHASLQSNLAATYSHWGLLEKNAGNLGRARAKYEKAVALDDDLIRVDPTNPLWQSYAVPTYGALADILQAMNRPREALVYYRKAFEASRDLAYEAKGDADLQEQFATTGKTLGDHANGLMRIEAYRTATLAMRRLLGVSDGAKRAANHYCDVVAFATAFDAAKDWPDAETAFALAERIARSKLDSDPSNAAWRDRVLASAKAAADEGTAAANAASVQEAQPAEARPACLAP